VCEEIGNALDQPVISRDRGDRENFIHKKNCAEKGMVNKF